MKITLNGQEKELTAAANLQALIEQYSPNNPRVVAELNGGIVKSPAWSETAIKDGDTVELVSFVGGG